MPLGATATNASAVAPAPKTFRRHPLNPLAVSLVSILAFLKEVDFENVGGEMFEAALWNMRDFGRIALCGMIANYNDEELQPGPRGMMTIIGRRLKIQGFIVTDHPDVCQEYVVKASAWLAEGKLKYEETIAEGIENAPTAFINMLQGSKTGKQIVRLADA